MSDTALFNSALTGRFYHFDEAPPLELELLKRASAVAWPEDDRQVCTQPSFEAWCTPKSPWTGRLLEAEDPLAYVFSGGVARMWLREEERKPPKSSVDDLAAQIAIEEHGTELIRCDKETKMDIRDTAKRRLVAQVLPKRRIVPILILEEEQRIFVVRRKASEDAGRLHRIFGACHPDPVAWDPTSSTGWESLSTAVCQHVLAQEHTELSSEVWVREIRIESSNIRLRTSSQISGDFPLQVLTAAFGGEQTIAVKQLELVVRHNGEEGAVVLDKDGLVRGVPPRSAGGLDADRLLRRLTDLLEAARKGGRAMATVLEQRLGIG